MPVYAGFLRIGKLVSVLVSVADPEPLKPLLHSQFGLEARVGIERGSFTVPSLTHSVSRFIVARFYRGSSSFCDRLLIAPPMPLYRSFTAR
jgi:hypothetical protein